MFLPYFVVSFICICMLFYLQAFGQAFTDLISSFKPLAQMVSITGMSVFHMICFFDFDVLPKRLCQLCHVLVIQSSLLSSQW